MTPLGERAPSTGSGGAARSGTRPGRSSRSGCGRAGPRRTGWRRSSARGGRGRRWRRAPRGCPRARRPGAGLAVGGADDQVDVVDEHGAAEADRATPARLSDPARGSGPLGAEPADHLIGTDPGESKLVAGGRRRTRATRSRRRGPVPSASTRVLVQAPSASTSQARDQPRELPSIGRVPASAGHGHHRRRRRAPGRNSADASAGRRHQLHREAASARSSARPRTSTRRPAAPPRGLESASRRSARPSAPARAAARPGRSGSGRAGRRAAVSEPRRDAGPHVQITAAERHSDACFSPRTPAAQDATRQPARPAARRPSGRDRAR